MPSEQRQVGPFKLLERLGAGGMGSVYLGVHQENGKRVAVKLLSSRLSGSKRAVARFNRELDILMKLRHPNIIRCFGGGRFQGQHFLVMELVKGGSLASILKRRGRLPWETVVEYSLQACAALEYAHDQGVIHRDLTPGNLLLTEKDVLKIADFGLARVTFGERLTATRHTLGTVAYMSPEQIRGSKHTSHKTDLYALGCGMFEMLAGRLPFAAESTAEMLYQHMEEEPPAVATIALDCPVWVDNLIQQLLAKDPDDRPQDAAAVSRALREIQQRLKEGEGIAQSTTAGGPSALRTNADTTDVRRLLGRRKKRRIAGGPIYERAWFLAACIAGIIALFAWAIWPPSERKLYEELQALMNDPAASGSDKLALAESLQSRFPDGQFADEVQNIRLQLDAEAADRRVRKKPKSSTDFTQVESSYLQAIEAELKGDLLAAHEKYEATATLFEGKSEGDDDEPLVWMCKKRVAELGERAKLAERIIDGLNVQLKEADELYEQGRNSRIKIEQAIAKWDGIIEIYGDNKTVGAQVEIARERLAAHKKRAAREANENANDVEQDPSEDDDAAGKEGDRRNRERQSASSTEASESQTEPKP